MSRLLSALSLLSLMLALSACQSGDEEGEGSKAPVAAPKAALTAPTSSDDREWKMYLQQVVAQNMDGVTDRVFPYYLPANSTTPTPGDPENLSQYDRQLENVSTVLARTVLPGNMLAFGSPDSTKMADLITMAFNGSAADALKGSQMLFIGKAEDNARVKAVAEAAGAKYVFVEAK